jgi:ubiquitin-protein ligase
MSLERLFTEYHELNSNPITNCGITVGLVNENSYKDWQLTMTGPKDSYYKGGIFFLNAHFPDNYPNEPPEVFFITPIYNLNVNPIAPRNEGDESLGHICISTLNWWKPEYKIREVLHNIYLLFYCQNPNSAYGTEKSKEYIEAREVYDEKVKFFTKKYANIKRNFKENDIKKDWDFSL